MNKLIKSALLTFFLMWSVSAYGAAVTTNTSNDGLTVQITVVDGDTDWVWTDTFTNAKYANGVRLNWIRFHPGATDDICDIEDYNDEAVKHFYVKCADTYDDRIQYYSGSKVKLEMDVSDGTYTAGCSLTIQLWPTQEP